MAVLTEKELKDAEAWKDRLRALRESESKMGTHQHKPSGINCMVKHGDAGQHERCALCGSWYFPSGDAA